MPRSARLLLVAAVAGLGFGTATPSHAVACNPLAQVVCQTAGYVCREVIYPIDQNVHMLACTWSA